MSTENGPIPPTSRPARPADGGGPGPPGTVGRAPPALPKLIEMLSGIDGLKDLTLTTNGSRLVQMAKELKDAGLNRITVSLDSLDDAVFRTMNDVDFPVSRVLDGIEEAARLGLTPVKVNMV